MEIPYPKRLSRYCKVVVNLPLKICELSAYLPVFLQAYIQDNLRSLVPHSTLRWRHNDHAGVSNHQPHGCLLNRLFRLKSKITSKLRVTGLCAGNSPGTGEFPAQMASYAENVSIWWRHHDFIHWPLVVAYGIDSDTWQTFTLTNDDPGHPQICVTGRQWVKFYLFFKYI